MTGRDIAEEIKSRAIVALDGEELTELLEASETLRADDTCLVGWIRILSLGGNLMVQEETPDGEILLRRAATREVAERFVERRLGEYERLWEGCGCKIDYDLALDED
jgi:hypothetical protein